MEATMVPLATLHELFGYNYWARDRQLEACAALSQEQFQRPLGNSFSSLRDTPAHLIGAEWYGWSAGGGARRGRSRPLRSLPRCPRLRHAGATSSTVCAGICPISKRTHSPAHSP